METSASGIIRHVRTNSSNSGGKRRVDSGTGGSFEVGGTGIGGGGGTMIDAGEVDVGLDGCLGFIINSAYQEGVFIGGWSFGGVRVEPVFGGDHV